MLTIYPACFYKENDGYSVIFPDLNYLSTYGKTLEEAFAMATDCLAGYLYSAKINNEQINKPSKLDNIIPENIASQLGFDYVECFANLVTIDVDEYAKAHFNKSIKKTLSIPEWLNKEALANNINFSQVLQEALINKLQSMK